MNERPERIVDAEIQRLIDGYGNARERVGVYRYETVPGDVSDDLADAEQTLQEYIAGLRADATNAVDKLAGISDERLYKIWHSRAEDLIGCDERRAFVAAVLREMGL